jgi:hypothetical protein
MIVLLRDALTYSSMGEGVSKEVMDHRDFVAARGFRCS